MDDILLQEIQSLKEKLKILTKIVNYYEPDFNESLFYHNLGTCDYQEYIESLKGGEKMEQEKDK